ncbi:Glutaredoxin [Tieghemiomyces parasiticus]|uniref:Glutaredoxin n=1 Tax=Tieghemiomyces parasiticus TaxID=78921 RepID=A0A9W8A5N4_9FUNG|nr:Glutaredoxin [Tieghemiomyces parasiticus]
MSQALRTKILEAIKANEAMVFSKSYCPFCVRAKQALKQVGAEFAVWELDKMPEGAEVQNLLQKMTGQRTVPNIYVKETHIGGCDDLIAAIASNKVQRLINGK